jgi:Flp pilus assembly protein CpaB
VAEGNVPAYSVLEPGVNIVLQEVPEDSITEANLTKKDLEASQWQLITRLEILEGQRIDRRTASASTTGTLGVVKEGEESVIALEASFRGIVGGIVGPGAIVDVYSAEQASEGTQILATDIKILGVGTGSSATDNIRSGEAQEVEAESNNATVLVIAAVPTETAGSLAGVGTVQLALDPYRSFDQQGNICPIKQCGSRNPATPGADPTPLPEDPTQDPEEDPSQIPEDGENGVQDEEDAPSLP